VASARELQYDDNLRKATYPGEARLNGPEGDLRASRIELFLAREGRELERLDAYDNVTLGQNSRVAVGDRLAYTATDERYVMTGKLVRITTENCQETIGRTLTFFRSTDRILVDGNEIARTQTTSRDCPGSPSR
jgi:lipopolysaccharide export system protein LptA